MRATQVVPARRGEVGVKTALRIVRSLLLGVVSLTAAFAIAVVALLYFAIDGTPVVSTAASLTPAHIERAKRKGRCLNEPIENIASV